jgi:hypothetical protein
MALLERFAVVSLRIRQTEEALLEEVTKNCQHLKL